MDGDGKTDIIVGEDTQPGEYAGGGPLVFWGKSNTDWEKQYEGNNPLDSDRTGFVGTLDADNPGFMGRHQRVACGE